MSVDPVLQCTNIISANIQSELRAVIGQINDDIEHSSLYIMYGM